MLTQNQKRQLRKFFQKEPVEAIYLFGSAAKGKRGPLSDLDFGILFSKDSDSRTRFNKQLQYYPLFSKIFSYPEERIDIVDLNSAPFPVAFSIISGKLIYEKSKMDRVNFEVKTMAKMATDFYFINRDYQFMIEKIKKGKYFYGA